jgi:hypothetical protein
MLLDMHLRESILQMTYELNDADNCHPERQGWDVISPFHSIASIEILMHGHHFNFGYRIDVQLFLYEICEIWS